MAYSPHRKTAKPPTTLGGVEPSKDERIRGLLDVRMQAHEEAQTEYDAVCELIKLVAPSNTAKAALQQRQLFNRLVVEALDGTYDHKGSYPAIVEAASPVLNAMRSDLGSPD